jgi:nucleoside 2-deoxyribosyltransferase
MTKRKVAVIGSREFNDRKLLYDTLTRNYDRIKLVISGGARGADTLAVNWASDYGVPYLVFPALWHNPFTGEHDKGAGFRRNRQIIEQCDIVLAFWDKLSRGTAHSIGIAKELGKPVKIVEFSRTLDPGEVVAADISEQMDASNNSELAVTGAELRSALKTHCDTTRKQLQDLETL